MKKDGNKKTPGRIFTPAFWLTKSRACCSSASSYFPSVLLRRFQLMLQKFLCVFVDEPGFPEHVGRSILQLQISEYEYRVPATLVPV